MALLVSGTACELREVKLSAKPQVMLDASPKGTVPVLVLPDGTVIDESLDVMRWALARNDPEDWLGRDDPDLIARNDGPFKHDLDRYKYPDRHGSDALAHRESGLEFLRDLDQRLALSDHLCGDRRSITDAAIIPFARQFAAVDPAWFESLPLRRVHRWLAVYVASALFTAAMVRIPPWLPGNQPVDLEPI